MPARFRTGSPPTFDEPTSAEAAARVIGLLAARSALNVSGEEVPSDDRLRAEIAAYVLPCTPPPPGALRHALTALAS